MNNEKNKVNLNRYETDVNGLSLKTLEAGLWWSKNRNKLKLLLTIILALIAIPSITYSIYGFGNYLLYGMNSDNQTMIAFNKTTLAKPSLLKERTAKDLILSPASYLGGGNSYDIYSQVINPNANWWATFNYCFKSSGSQQACDTGFILPNDKKYILSLAQTLSGLPLNIAPIISNVQWYKLDNHSIPNWNNYENDRLIMDVSNQQFLAASENSLSEKLALNALSFSIANKSPYSYWSVPVIIILSGQNGIDYVNKYLIDNFGSYDSKDIKITWTGDIGSVTSISVTPDINILDPEVYQKPQ
jgi:hypothetical protein